MDFENFVSNRIGLGRYHYILVLSAIFIEMTDGIQTLTISLCTPIIKQHDSLESAQVSLLSSTFTVGVGIGNLVFGVMSNTMGRRKPVLIGIAVQLLSGLFLTLSLSYFWLLVGRFFYGVGFGSTIATTIILLSESIPLKHRGRALLLFNFGGSIGRVLGAFLAYLFLHHYQQHQRDWDSSVQSDENQMNSMSVFILISTIPCLLSLILNSLVIKQSYRYLLYQKQYSEAYSTIDSILQQNGHQNLLTDSEKQDIRTISGSLYQTDSQSSNSWAILTKYKYIISLLSLMWFFNNFVLFGEFFIVPIMLYSHSSGLTKYLWMTLGQFPVFVLNWFLIQTALFGRKWTLCLSFLLSSVLCFVLIGQLTSVSLFFAKFFIKESVQVLIPFTPESFPTEARGVGSGIAQAIGKVGGTVMPFIIYPLYVAYPNSPFLILGICSLLGSVSCCLVPNDTYGRPLDHAYDRQITLKSSIAEQELQQIQ